MTSKKGKQHYARVSLAGLALRNLQAGSLSERCYCEVKIAGSKHPPECVPLPVVPLHGPDPDITVTAVTIYLGPEDFRNINNGERTSFRKRHIEVTVMTSTSSWWCGRPKEAASGSVRIPMTEQWSRGYSRFQPMCGWKPVGSKGMELHLCVTVEADPRFQFEFEGPAVFGPQVVNVDGARRQPVFTCRFRNESGGHRRSSSSHNSVFSSPSLPSTPGSQKECKGWMVIVHDLAGATVAAASMVQPFVPGSSNGKVSEDNPGAWLILRPSSFGAQMQPWARLAAWREQSGPGVTCQFELIGDQAVALDGTLGAVVSRGKLNVRQGGDFSLHAVVPRVSPRAKALSWDSNETGMIDLSRSLSSKESTLEPGSAETAGSAATDTSRSSLKVQPVGSGKMNPVLKLTPEYRRSRSRRGSGGSIDFGEGEGIGGTDEGFVVKISLRRGSQASSTSLQIGRPHLTRFNDAAVFVALAAAVELSVEACQSSSKMVKQVLMNQEAGAYL